MAAICHQFVQNAWKKDLCSNCFKCKEEHNGGTTCKSRYLATMYPSGAHSWRAPHSILKDTQQVRRPKGSTVHFPAEESQVIGFGGGECFSSDGEDTADQDESAIRSDGEEGEEEHALQKLTRNNTDFNSNLSHSGLELGKPVTDSEGKRKTLLVSVTPFEKKSYNLPIQNSKDVILKSLVKHNDAENVTILRQKCESIKQNDTNIPSDIIINRNVAETYKITNSRSFKDHIESTSRSSSDSNNSKSDVCSNTSHEPLKENENKFIGSVLNGNDEKCMEIPSNIADDINSNSHNSVLNRGIAEKYKDSPIKPIKKHESRSMPFGSFSSRNCTEKFKDIHFNSQKKNEYNSSLSSFSSRNIVEKFKVNSLTPSKQNISVAFSDSACKGESIVENCRSDTMTSTKENESSLSSTFVSKRNSAEKCMEIFPQVLKQNESSGVKMDKSDMDKCIDSKQGECETLTRLANKCGAENDKISRIPVIKTRPKPAARKSYDLMKKNEVALKKVSAIKQTLENTPSHKVRQTLETLSTQEVKQTPESTSHQEIKENLVSTSCQEVRQVLEKKSQDEASNEKVELGNNMEISTQQQNEEDVNCNNKLEVIKTSKEVVALPDETSTKECEHMFSMEESRELAGEPDGRADPDEPAEPPALPQSPPPVVDPRPSFLHGVAQVKPKIPAKPTAKLLQATPRRIVLPREEVELLDTESSRSQKRQAPKPPPIPVEETPSSPLLLIPPVIQDKTIAKEIAPSCDLDSEIIVSQCPEPVPRKILTTPDSDKKKTPTGKAKFSLRKFLRLGSSKEDKTADQIVAEEFPVPRPRLEIIHPSELNGSNVEVVGRSSDENDSSPGRLTKPPPPPRNQSLAIEGFNRPARPPPPKSAELLQQQKQIKEETPIIQSSNNLYANLGEVRSGLTPSKPQRTSSIRDCSSEGPRRKSSDEPVYECVRYKRSASLPYCSSEAGSDIYSPYSLYSDDACDSDSGHPWKTSKLRLRKGRSVVHRSLEDNYGAVIVANHEALAQVLEQVHVSASVPPALRALKIAPNLCWTNFTVQEEACVTVGRRAFHPAVWGSQPVTLVVTQDQSLQSKGCLCPLAEFSDLVPMRFLPSTSRDSVDVIQACVGVLSRMQVDSISSYGISVQNRLPEEDRHRDGSFMLLQLINALKNLQAEGIEETSLSSFALCREDRDLQPRLCVLRGSRDEVSLCKCALLALDELLPSSPLTTVLKDLLQQERAVSLSQVKSVLEFSLWGPADVTLGLDREMVLQRWLDLERATVLQGLVRSRVELTALEECHLLFLVRTSAKTMCEASFLLDTSNPETTSF